MNELFSGISLINIQLFCHKLWTRNAKKSSKPSKDLSLSHKIGLIGRLPGGDDVI